MRTCEWVVLPFQVQDSDSCLVSGELCCHQHQNSFLFTEQKVSRTFCSPCEVSGAEVSPGSAAGQWGVVGRECALGSDHLKINSGFSRREQFQD